MGKPWEGRWESAHNCGEGMRARRERPVGGDAVFALFEWSGGRMGRGGEGEISGRGLLCKLSSRERRKVGVAGGRGMSEWPLGQAVFGERGSGG